MRVAYVGLEPQKEVGNGKGKGKGKKAKRRESSDGACAEGGKKVGSRRRLPVKMPRPLWVML